MPIRVLVVDDSAFMRRVIGEAITAQPDMALAGLASNGLDALLKVEQLQPDVVTLDVEMPEMDGLTALRHLMARYPRPVVMVSSMTQAGATTTIRALSIGAVDFVAKPSGAISLDFHIVRDELLKKIRIAARARVPAQGPGVRDQGSVRCTNGKAPSRSTGPRPLTPDPSFDRLIVIGSSTGGPRALGSLVPELPDDGRTAYVVVQHMPAGFTKSLANRLDSTSQLSVREAEQGDQVAAGQVLIAPGDRHLRLSASGAVDLDDGPRVHGVRPAVDVALFSAAQHFGGRVVAVVLTGMGQDGAAGAATVHQAGGSVLAEDESTCVVWGMPRAVIQRGVADRIVPLHDMAKAILEVLEAHPLAARSSDR